MLAFSITTLARGRIASGFNFRAGYLVRMPRCYPSRKLGIPRAKIVPKILPNREGWLKNKTRVVSPCLAVKLDQRKHYLGLGLRRTLKKRLMESVALWA